MMYRENEAPVSAYEVLMEAATDSLLYGELWCVFHPDGPLEMTASERVDIPILMTCEALGADWEDLKDQGFYLGKISNAQ